MRQRMTSAKLLDLIDNLPKRFPPKREEPPVRYLLRDEFIKLVMEDPGKVYDDLVMEGLYEDWEFGHIFVDECGHVGLENGNRR
jgi:hypothetical protein